MRPPNPKDLPSSFVARVGLFAVLILIIVALIVAASFLNIISIKDDVPQPEQIENWEDAEDVPSVVVPTILVPMSFWDSGCGHGLVVVDET